MPDRENNKCEHPGKVRVWWQSHETDRCVYVESWHKDQIMKDFVGYNT